MRRITIVLSAMLLTASAVPAWADSHFVPDDPLPRPSQPVLVDRHAGSPAIKISSVVGQTVVVTSFEVSEEDDYFTYSLDHVVVESYSSASSGGARDEEEHPTEELSLRFDAADPEYEEQEDRGGVRGTVPSGVELDTTS